MKLESLAILLFLMPVLSVHAGETTRYFVEIENTWSEATHPGAFPHEAHFSLVGGATHNDNVSFWSLGEVASPSIVQMAEKGGTSLLIEEVEATVNDGRTYSVVNQRTWFCPESINHPSCGPSSFEVDASSDFPMLTLVTMLGPSPDWFVGIDSLPLRTDAGWINEFDIALYPYDGGTRTSNVFRLGGPQNIPPEPISLITEESGQIITPQTLGRVLLRRIVPCDLDGDYECDDSDIDLLTNSVNLGTQQFDLDGSGSTNEQDRRYWVEELMGTKFGDANLDGSVGFPDFLALAASFSQPVGWAGGNFDGSETTDFADFLILSRNFDTAAATVSSVPEVDGHLLFLVPSAIAFLLRRRTRASRRAVARSVALPSR